MYAFTYSKMALPIPYIHAHIIDIPCDSKILKSVFKELISHRATNKSAQQTYLISKQVKQRLNSRTLYWPLEPLIYSLRVTISSCSLKNCLLEKRKRGAKN